MMIPIATITANGSTSAFDFQNIPQTFTHLQLRCFVGINTGSVFFCAINNVYNNTKYPWHRLYGDGASTASGSSTTDNQMLISDLANSATTFGSFIIDILDYTNTNKNRVIKSIGGFDKNGSGQVSTSSGLYIDTTAVSRITLNSSGGNVLAGSRVDLYGITTSSVTGA